jgi:histone demethylase JARID1
VPVFRPSREEFQDPLNYIASISDVGKRFGICKIVPPTSDEHWHPQAEEDIPPTIDPKDLTFRTKLQNVHQLKHRASRSEAFHHSFALWQNARGELFVFGK